MSEIKNIMLGLYGAEDSKCSLLVTLGSKRLNIETALLQTVSHRLDGVPEIESAGLYVAVARLIGPISWSH